jgi:hypothetical protein
VGGREDVDSSCKSDVNASCEADSDSSRETLVEQEVESGSGLKDDSVDKDPQDAELTGINPCAHTVSATYEVTEGRAGAGAVYASTKDDFGDFSASVVYVDPLFSSAG